MRKRRNHHCFFPFFFLLLPLLLKAPLPLKPVPALVVGLSEEVLAPKLSNSPDCTAFCNHSTNSSSVMVSSRLDVGIQPPLWPELVPLPVLCLEVKQVFTWKLGWWVLAGHLIPCNQGPINFLCTPIFLSVEACLLICVQVFNEKSDNMYDNLIYKIIHTISSPLHQSQIFKNYNTQQQKIYPSFSRHLTWYENWFMMRRND